MTRKEFYRTKAWQDCRNRYFEMVGGLCETCRAKGKIVKGEIVHHKIELTPDNIDNPDITLNWDNLQCLCRECHAEVHELYERKRRYKIDELGRVISRENA